MSRYTASGLSFLLDGEEVPMAPGDTVLQAAHRVGCYIPHLCWHPGLPAHGSCRLCMVNFNGRPVSACTALAAPGAVVECQTPALQAERRTLLQMLFVEGNHFCPSCERSGNCLLQATAYQHEMAGPHFEEFYPGRPVDASHPDMLLDHNRCILCGLCVRASELLDGKSVFAIAGHGIRCHLVVDSPSGQLGDSALSVHDQAAGICPVGALMPKRVGFRDPIGQRRYDLHRVDEPHSQEAAPPADEETP